MALQLNRESKWWYGRVIVNGRKMARNLGVEVRGTPPPKLSMQGDLAFERSRAKAQAALEKLQLDLKKRSTAEELVQTLHEIRTGSRVGSIPLTEIGDRWKALPRRRPLNARYLDQADSWLKRFVAFIGEHSPTITAMDQVQPNTARAFMDAEAARGVSPKTYNNTLIFLRSCFEALKEDGGLAKNPFAGLPTREEDTIFRKPFTVDELAAIIAAAKKDPFIYPIVVTAICTALRRGDCCMLQKSAVDLPHRFIKVKTSKTGGWVQIPIFPLLQEVLEKRPKDDSDYVFHEQSLMYELNPDNITLRVRKVMRAAGFFDPEETESDEEKAQSRGEIHQERKNGLRKGSVRDFHSFRVTWVTLALTAGVPMEIVRKVTGHRTAEIVMKHYFQPGREDFRRTLAGKLPTLLGGGASTKPLELVDVRAKLVTMQPRTWRKIRDELVAGLPAPEKPLEIETVPPPSKPPPSRISA